MYTLLNIIWLLLIGWELAVILVVVGLLFCFTLLGIPLGLKCFQLIPVIAWPFRSSAAM